MSEEEWKDIPGFEGYYQASTKGAIRSLPRYGHHKASIALKPYRMSNGYLQVTLYSPKTPKKHYLVHRLIALTFLPNSENRPHVNHIDGDKSNNNADNLEWATQSENMRHSTYVLGNEGVHKRRPVMCVETGEVFSSIHEAGRTTGVHPANIVSALNGRLKSAGKLHWAGV